MPTSLPPGLHSGVNGSSFPRAPDEPRQEPSGDVRPEPLPDKKIPTQKHQVSELPDENDEVFSSLRPAQILLHKSQAGRVVSHQQSVSSASDDEEFYDAEEYFDASEDFYESQGFHSTTGTESKHLENRGVTETNPGSKSRFSWLNPFSGRRKSTSERSVSKSHSAAEVETINHGIWELIKSKVIDKYIYGLKSWEIPNLLQTMSTVYLQWKNRDAANKGVTPEIIHLSTLTVPSALGEGKDLFLSNVTINIRKVRPCGTGEGYDKFKQLRVFIDINGDAELKTGHSRFSGAVSLKDVLIDMHFRDGAVIGKFLQSGTLTGTAPRAIWQIFDANFFSNIKNYALGKLIRSSTPSPGFWKGIQDYLFKNILPHNVKIKPAHKHIHFTGTSANNAGCTVDAGFDELELNLDKHLPDGTEAHQVTLKGARFKGKGQHILHFLPEQTHEQVARYLPYAKHSQTMAEVETDQLSILYGGTSISAACPNVKVKTQGDVDLSQGHITNLAAVIQTTPESKVPEVTVGFDEIKADAHIPLATFQLPYDVRGPVGCEKAAVRFSPVSEEDGSHQGFKIAAQISEAHADIEGGLEFTGSGNRVSVNYDTNESKLDLTVKHASVDHFNITSGGSQINPSNQIIKGNGVFQGIQLNVTPEKGPAKEDQEPSMVTTIEVEKAKTGDLKGQVTAHHANLSDVTITHKFTGEMTQQIDVTANKIESSRIFVPDHALAGYAAVDLDRAKLNKVSASCEVQAAPLTDSEREAAHKTIPIPGETWKIPESVVVSANIDVAANNTSGYISAAIPLPEKQEDEQGVSSPSKAYTTGSFDVKTPDLTIKYDADTGYETVTLKTRSALLDMDHGDIRGEVQAQQIQAGYVQHSSNDPNTATVHASVLQAVGTRLTIDGGLRPEGVQITTDFHAEHPEAHVDIKTDSQTGKIETETTFEIENASLSTDLAISRSKLIPGSTREKAQKLRTMLPAEYREKLEGPLHYLETIQEEPNDELERSTLQQTVAVAAHKLHTELATGQSSTLDLNTDSFEIEVSKGTVQARAQLKDIEAHARLNSENLDTTFHVDEIVADRLSTKGNANISLNNPAIITGVKVGLRQGNHYKHFHTEIETADIDAKAGASGITQPETAQGHPLEPAHIKIQGQHIEVDAEQHRNSNIATTQIQKLHFELDNTTDQMGLNIKVNADLTDGLLDISSTEDQLHVNASAEKIHMKTEKDLNGVMDVHDTGITVFQDDQGVKINTRIDSKKTRFDFEDPARELIQILTRERLAQSPLGKACELSATPNLDNTLTGTVSGSARGVLSPLIELLLTVVTSRKTRALLHTANIFSGTMKFGIRVKSLSVREGRIKVSDIFKCTSIEIFSELGIHGKVYAGLISFMANYLAPWILKPIMTAMNLTNKSTGELSLTTLTKYTGRNIQLVSNEDLPQPHQRNSSQLLKNAHQLLLTSRTLPEWWDEQVYIDSLKQRLSLIRWKNKALADNEELSERELKDLYKTMARDFPLPATAGDFRRINTMLDLFQQELRRSKEHISIQEAYENAHAHMAESRASRISVKSPGSIQPDRFRDR